MILTFRRFPAILFLFSVFQVYAQQPLGPGSIAFLAMQTGGRDAFAFAAMQDIAANDTIYFTDNGWSGTAFFNNEQTLRWYSSNPVLRGSVIRISDPAGSEPNAIVSGFGTSLGKLNNLSTSGEQLFAYRIASGGGIIHLSAISNRNWLDTCNSTGTGNTTTSCLPQALTLGVNAFAFSGNSTETDNVFLNIPQISGTPNSVLEQINGNAMNWFGSNDTSTSGSSHWPDWQFQFSDPNTAQVQFAGTNPRNQIEGTGPQTITLSLSNPLAVASHVTLTISHIGGADGSDYQLNPAAVNQELMLTFSPGQTSISFTLELIDDGDDETGEGLKFAVSSASSELTYSTPTELLVNFSDLSNLSSVLDFSSATYSVNEGEQVSIGIKIVPPAAQPGNVSVQLQSGIGVEGSDFSTVPAVAGGFINIGIPQGADQVSFTISASDDALNESDEEITFTLHSVSSGFAIGTEQPSTLVLLIDNDEPNEVPVLFINELMSTNTQTVQDENGEYDDWFEIFNPGSEAVDVGGMYVSDDKNNPTKHQIPTGNPATIIPAGGYLLLWADEQVNQGPTHAGFKFSANGEFIGLYADDSEISRIDSLTFPMLQADESFGRQTDGGPQFIRFMPGSTTPGASNQTSSVAQVDKLGIRLYPNPADEQIWISGLSSNSTYRIYDISGRMVNTGQISPTQNRLDLSNIPSGFYQIQLGCQGQPKISLPFLKNNP